MRLHGYASLAAALIIQVQILIDIQSLGVGQNGVGCECSPKHSLLPLFVYVCRSLTCVQELDAFMVQRMRWAVGAIQIVRAGNPLFTPGLHLKARWLYFFSTIGIVYILFVVAMGIIMYATILAGAPVGFGPTSFEQYLILGGTAVAQVRRLHSLYQRVYVRACLLAFVAC